MLEIIRVPWVERRAKIDVLEIPITTPMKGMFQQSDKLWKELNRFLSDGQIEEDGPYYLRFRVVNMEGEMAMSLGVPVKGEPTGNPRVHVVTLPEGNYACLRYVGHGLVANKLLLAWIRDEGLTMDRWEDPKGDAFRNRRETFLTDRRVEPLKKKWIIELSIKLRDEEPH